VYHDIKVADSVTQLVLTITRLETHIALSSMEIYIGQDDPSRFVSSNLKQDASRTWLVFNGLKTTFFEIDTLDIRGKAHLGVQNDNADVSLLVRQYKGDFSGTFHVGRSQSVNFTLTNNSVIPFSLRAYQVRSCM
jgi:hypothetical protein